MLRGFETDRRIPGLPTKEIQAPCVVYDEGAGPDRIHPVRLGPGIVNNSGGITFRVPWNFHGWVTAEIVYRGLAGGIRALNIVANGASCGEAHNTHTQNWVGGVNMPNTLITCQNVLTDLAAFFAALTAGDDVFIEISRNAGANFLIYHFYGRYI